MGKEQRENYRKRIIEILVDELSALRAKAGISQEELSEYIGISRQTISVLERKKRLMTWQVALAIILYFTLHPRTNKALKTILGFIETLQKCFDYDESE